MEKTEQLPAPGGQTVTDATDTVGAVPFWTAGLGETAGVAVVHRDNECGRGDLQERNSAARWYAKATTGRRGF